MVVPNGDCNVAHWEHGTRTVQLPQPQLLIGTSVVAGSFLVIKYVTLRRRIVFREALSISIRATSIASINQRQAHEPVARQHYCFPSHHRRPMWLTAFAWPTLQRFQLTANCKTIAKKTSERSVRVELIPSPKLFVRLQNKQRKRGFCIRRSRSSCGDPCRELPQDRGTNYFDCQLRSCARALNVEL
jgi:hypothetical protein